MGRCGDGSVLPYFKGVGRAGRCCRARCSCVGARAPRWSLPWAGPQARRRAGPGRILYPARPAHSGVCHTPCAAYSGTSEARCAGGLARPAGRGRRRVDIDAGAQARLGVGAGRSILPQRHPRGLLRWLLGRHEQLVFALHRRPLLSHGHDVQEALPVRQVRGVQVDCMHLVQFGKLLPSHPGLGRIALPHRALLPGKHSRTDRVPYREVPLTSQRQSPVRVPRLPCRKGEPVDGHVGMHTL